MTDKEELLEKYNIDKNDEPMVDWIESMENQPKDYTNLLLAITIILMSIVVIIILH